MNIEQLVRRAHLFYKLSGGDSDSSAEILKKLSEFETFKDRVDYAEDKMEHLSSGSSRVIYIMPDDTVLKLAKNERGVAQNVAEANPKMKSKFINKTIKADKDGLWKTSPFLDKITEKDFEEMTDVPFEDFGEAIEYGLKGVADNSGEKKPKNFEKVEKLDLYRELVKLGKEFKLMPGDIARISSWGQVDGHPCLLDAGLTKDIYEEFYESS